MGPATQEASSYLIWQTPGSQVAVHLHLDVVDRLGAEVLRGFGAVPKRGAEVGGLLLGFVEPGEVTNIRIEDFEAVPCKYSRGPSYLYSEEEEAAFEEAFSRWQNSEAGAITAVGYFRSHTREGMSLAEEDLDLMNHFFPGPEAVALLVKPFATKASIAGFFTREAGEFPAETPLEFPFRRRDITGEAPPPRRSMLERRSRRRSTVLELEPQFGMDRPDSYGGGNYSPADVGPAFPVPPARRPFWEWTPLALLLLLVGLILGFGAALRFAPLIPAGSTVQQFGLNLSVTRTGENLNVRWNPDAQALRSAQRAVLEIEDGGFSKPVELDPAHLRDGNVIYQNTSGMVRFRLTVYLDQRLSVTETIDWRE